MHKFWDFLRLLNPQEKWWNNEQNKEKNVAIKQELTSLGEGIVKRPSWFLFRVNLQFKWVEICDTARDAWSVAVSARRALQRHTERAQRAMRTLSRFTLQSKILGVLGPIPPTSTLHRRHAGWLMVLHDLTSQICIKINHPQCSPKDP